VILLFGCSWEPTFALTLRAAQQTGADVLLVDQADPAGAGLTVEDEESASGCWHVDGATIPLADVGAVFARPLAAPTLADPAAARYGQALADLAVEWLDVAPGLVVNRPSAMTSNASKPYQAQVIGQHGFRVPETVITTLPEEVRVFAERHRGVVYKSTSGTRSIVRRLDAPALHRLDRIRWLPTQFQEEVPGVDVRVHVVGEDVFATEIASDAVDYRYAGRDGLECDLRAVRLDDEVAQRCVALAAALDLPLAGIDLRRTPEGEVVCFEVNPMPGYSFVEEVTGQSISAALVHRLTEASGWGAWSAPHPTAPV
jgi:ribosomal protein S6-L-glutamate ligase RimK-like protein